MSARSNSAVVSSLLLLTLAIAPGCGDEGDAWTDQDVEDEVLTHLEAFPTGFTKINDARFVGSMHNTFDTDIYVLDEWADAYRQVDPDAMGSMPDIGEGAMIVKELFLGDERMGATVKFKGPAGYDEAYMDWYRGYFDADLQVTESGRIAYCADCHIARESDDGLWGVPLDNRL
jgi:hypothetical protein